MAETRTLNDRYAELGRALVESEPLLAPILDSQATICYLGSDRAKRSKGRTVFGECERVADKNKWAIPADFLIVVYEPNCAGMDDAHLSRLLFHELLHVGIDAGEGGAGPLPQGAGPGVLWRGDGGVGGAGALDSE